jgi:spermidine dehydrogenase
LLSDHALASSKTGLDISWPAGDSSYPPGLQGLRGNHDGSQQYPHMLRDGQAVPGMAARHETGEQYDLVVVGAGISGLSAAYFYRKRFGLDARILVLDNHDDFGGHARRNEFDVDGRTLLSYGGTQAIDSPGTYRPVAMSLLRELGVDIDRLARRYHRNAYRGLTTACFFDQETFGADRMVAGMGSRPWADFLKDAPLSERARSDLLRLYTSRKDYLAGMSIADKRKRLQSISYAQYLVQHCGVDEASVAFLRTYPHDLFGVGIDAVSALTCYQNPDDYDSFTYAGFDGLGLEPVEKEPYIYMFPDGGSSIARLLLRSLIPPAVSASSADEIVKSHVRYELLDGQGAQVRLRLRSAVVAVEQGDGATGEGVTVDYATGAGIERVRARHCVLACYNGMIPYLCPGLPEEQKQALHYGAKAPFLYTHVALKNWRAFAKLGTRQIVAPGGYHSYTALAFPVDANGYQASLRPDDPMVLFMMRAPCAPGIPRRDQHRAGRGELLATSFASIEGNVRDQLQRMLGGAGFDHRRDIAGLTVNRWAHGYAYEYDTLFDPIWPKGSAPHEIGRHPYGAITIANSDSGASAYMDSAIDMAFRAVGELPSARAQPAV